MRFASFLISLLAMCVPGLTQLALAQTAEEPDHEAAMKNPDGSWKYTNRLIDSSSPYLLQHAHNPVDWHPWDEEAIAAAKAQGKPIFLSVGYSTCYWCHVMEREVFSNPEIAALMNERFINIKVDREERPDLDKIYMTATQLISGRGGWPNSVFMTPDLKPFFAATYIGPDDIPGPPGQRPRLGFPSYVTMLSDAWMNEREMVLNAADDLSGAMIDALVDPTGQGGDGAAPSPLTSAISEFAVAQLASSYDPNSGGFSTAPKFPSAYTFPYLLNVHKRTGDERALNIVTNTLHHMAAGGIHDHVGGGFHRYATDGAWRVPHFEKMLYNQGQIARAYIEAFEVTGDERLAETVHDIFKYTHRRMSDPTGLFYSALDAETDAVEGDYYVWNRTQIESLLDAEELTLFDSVFLLADVPIFPGHKHPDGGVLCMTQPVDQLAAALEVTPGDLVADLAPILAKLEKARQPRKLPRLDDKAIVSWNAIMIDAYALAGRVLENETYTANARGAADFILANMIDETGTLKRIWRGGEVMQDGFLEDYAFLAKALVTLNLTTDDSKYLEAALSLTATANERLWDEIGGGYFFAIESDDLLTRTKSAGDAALPSGNAVMAHVLLDLAEITGDDSHRQRADELFGAFAEELTQIPAGHIHLVHALDRFLDAAPEGTSDQAGDSTPIAPTSHPVTVSSPSDPNAFDSSAHVALTASIESGSIAQGQSFDVTLTLDMDPNWHVNANPASESYLIATTADVRSELPVAVGNVKYPEGHEISLAGDPISVYETGTTITISCSMGADATVGDGMIRVIVSYQACDDGSCLPPTDTILELPVTITSK